MRVYACVMGIVAMRGSMGHGKGQLCYNFSRVEGWVLEVERVEVLDD